MQERLNWDFGRQRAADKNGKEYLANMGEFAASTFVVIFLVIYVGLLIALIYGSLGSWLISAVKNRLANTFIGRLFHLNLANRHRDSH